MKQRNIELLKNNEFGSKSIPRLVLSFAATTFVALILNSVYNITDTLFVSWGVGDHAMGGVSIAFPLILLQGAISTAIGGGAASLVSRKLGEGKGSEAGEITLNAMITFYATALIITALGLIFLNPLLKLLGATDDLYGYAKDYLIIILIGNVFSTGFSSIVRAEGKMLYGFMMWVVPISINIILDAIFILVLGWGVKGSAIATVISQFCSFAMSVFFFLKISNQSFKGAKIKWKRVGDIVAIGLPSLVQMSCLSIATIFMNNVLRDVSGTLGVTSFAYMSKIMTFMIVPFTAITQALSPIVGYNYGAGKTERVRKTIEFCAIISFAYAVVALLLAEAIPQYLIKMFTKNEQLIAAGATGMRIVAIVMPFTPLPMLVGATLQAEGKKLWSLIMFASSLLFLIAPLFLMGKYLGIKGVWWAYVLAGVLSTAFAVVKICISARKDKTNVDNSEDCKIEECNIEKCGIEDNNMEYCSTEKSA